MIITEALIKWKNGENRKGAGVVCTILRRSDVKEHFMFAVLRDSEMDGAMKGEVILGGMIMSPLLLNLR